MKKTWLKLVLATSLDGRIALDGAGESHLGGQGDRQVLEEALAWADATLFGRRTLSVHKNICLINNPELLKKRKLNNLTQQPIAIVVGSQKRFNREWSFFQQPVERWLLTTQETSLDPLLDIGFDKALIMKNNWEDILTDLGNQGISQIVVLGGSLLASSLMNEDQIDELQLTITPRVLGGVETWIKPEFSHLPMANTSTSTWNLKQVRQLEENDVMLRYIRARNIATNAAQSES